MIVEDEEQCGVILRQLDIIETNVDDSDVVVCNGLRRRVGIRELDRYRRDDGRKEHLW